MADLKERQAHVIATRIAEARKASARKWAHTPLSGKRPILDGWTSLPVATMVEIEQWARTNNLGIRTGHVSGIVVIDDDNEDSSTADALGLPRTVTVITGSGRRHYYFRAPSEPIGNSNSKLASKVDVKGDGGVVTAVGSIHPDTGSAYVWAPGHSPDEIALAELPAAIIAKLRRKSKSDPFARGTHLHCRLSRYAEGALKRERANVASAPEGARNNALNVASFLLGRFVGVGLLERDVVERELSAAASLVGLEEHEIGPTIASGVGAGIDDPWDLKTLAGSLDQADTRLSDAPATPTPDERARPTIAVEGGKLPEIVTAAEQALLADGGSQLYQRENMLVRMARSSSIEIDDGIRRTAGALTLITIEPAYLIERFTSAASFQKFDKRLDGYRVVDCPERVAATYLARKGLWTVPKLRAVIEAPTLRPDGSILQVPGYDKATGLFFDPGVTAFMPVPDSPTLDDAHAALALLHELLKGFPFVERADRAVALSAVLTGLVRRSLRSAPLFAFRAPKMSSGKSLLADVTSMFATGRPVPAMSQGTDEEEDRKRYFALLLEGEPVNCIDNIERPLSSSTLCSILTQSTIKDRILGHSAMATVPTCATWLANGNNLVIVGDLTTRVLVCDLDAGVERPEERVFDVNLYEHVPERRGALVAAALTILRAYWIAGRPRQNLKVFGRFEGWSAVVRSALVWCGEPDPCLTRARVEQLDPVRRQIHAVLCAWIDGLGSRTLTAAELIAAAKQPKHAALHQALVDAVGGVESELSPMRLGNWLTKHERRLEGGLRVERMGERQGTTLWSVARG